MRPLLRICASSSDILIDAVVKSRNTINPVLLSVYVGNIQLPSDGTQTIMVGATLNMGTIENYPKGIYAGSYDITFIYNQP
jgi:hypothetical protein